MTSIEDRIRAATRAAAGTVPPGGAPPLCLPPGQARPARANSPGRRWRGWVTPLAAAAAATAAICVSVAVTSLAGPASTLAGHGGASGAGTAVPAFAHPATVDGLPPFFMTLGRTADTVAIASTATGRVVTTVRLPGKAYRLAAGSDGRTFYAAVAFLRCQRGPGPTSAPGTGSVSAGTGTAAGNPAEGGKVTCRDGAGQPRTYFYKITVTGSGATTSVLPILPVTVSASHIRPAQRGYFPVVAAISPSPGGGQLAFTTYTVTAHEGLIRTLYIASTTTGMTREWNASNPGGMNGYLSWLAGGRAVAFDWLNSGSRAPASGLRTLPTSMTRPGHDLLSGSPVLPMTVAGDTFKTLMASPDASTVIAYTPRISPKVTGPGTNAGGGPTGRVVVFPIRTGKPTVVFTEGRRSGGTYSGCRILWVSHAGQHVLLGCGFNPAGTHARQVRVLLTGPGHSPRVLPWLSSPASPQADISQGVLAER